MKANNPVYNNQRRAVCWAYFKNGSKNCKSRQACGRASLQHLHHSLEGHLGKPASKSHWMSAAMSLLQSHVGPCHHICAQVCRVVSSLQQTRRLRCLMVQGLMHTTWIAGVPGEEGGTERGAQHGQQAWQVLLRMGTQGSQTICHMYQPHFLTRQSERLHRHQAMRLHSSVSAHFGTGS